MSNTLLLELDNISKTFPAGSVLNRKYVTAVDKVSFDMPVDKPIMLTIAGESGSGKTTISKLILGLLTPTEGVVRYNGKDIQSIDKEEWKIFRKDVQAVFQDPYSLYNPFYKIDRVFETVISKFKLATSSSEAHDLTIKSMELVGLRPEDLLGRYPHQLSGGERQRIMLARLLMIRPKLVVADEPISMIDVSLRAMFLNTLMKFNKLYGMSTIFITHNLTNAYYLGGDLIVLNQGKVVEYGPMDTIIKNPLHPYTQVLIESLPHTTPKERWQNKLDMKTIGIMKSREENVAHGCIFYERCKHAMEKCNKETPPLEQVKKGQKVACFLY